MIRTILARSGKNIPYFIFENAFKNGRIPFLSKNHIIKSKKNLSIIYNNSLEKAVLKYIDEYISNITDYIPHCHFLFISLHSYKNVPNFDNFYSIIYNYDKSISGIKNYANIARATHLFYSKVIKELSDKDFKILLNSIL